jgi:hypothetical protein
VGNCEWDDFTRSLYFSDAYFLLSHRFRSKNQLTILFYHSIIHLEIDFQDHGQSIRGSERFWRIPMSKKSKCCKSYKKKGKACKKCPLFR